ncbi:MAG: very short patch repair endonuclease [Acidobacteriota bacterium]|nr:very short patch repair endonuclease [Acidobacteriota bacterium]
MSRVRSKNTGPELLVRQALWASGIRYRLHGRNMPGHPDLVFAGRKAVVFVHGCFWHRHENCPRNRIPKSRVEWWTAKFARNRERDLETRSRLETSGWRVLVIWECEVERAECLAALIAELKSLPRGKWAGAQVSHSSPSA